MPNSRHSPGFTIIEFAIAMTLASLVSLMVFALVRQTTKHGARVAAVVESARALMVAQAQLGRDLDGIMVPEASFAAYGRALKEGQKREAPLAKQEAGPGAPEKAPEKTKEEKRTKEIPAPFVVKNGETNLELLYFTTTSRMPRHKLFVSYNTRVVYQLLADTEPHTWRLVRTESSSITKPIEELLGADVPHHTLLTRLKAFSVKLFVPEEPKQPQKKEEGKAAVKKGGKEAGPVGSAAPSTSEPEKKSEEEKKIIYRELTAWGPAETKKSPALVPAYLEFSGVRIETGGHEQPFSFAYRIPIFVWQYERLKKLAASASTPRTAGKVAKGATAKGQTAPAPAGAPATAKGPLPVRPISPGAPGGRGISLRPSPGGRR